MKSYAAFYICLKKVSECKCNTNLVINYRIREEARKLVLIKTLSAWIVSLMLFDFMESESIPELILCEKDDPIWPKRI